MKIRLTDKLKSYSPLIIYSALIMVFSVFFTRYFIKMDDGNFMGIVSSPDFTYLTWLTKRYLALSGRTVGEFLLSYFLKQNIIFWQIINALLIIYIATFWYKLSKRFSGSFSDKNKQIFACCGLFTMFVSCLNPSVFWYAGSFSYLWPFAGFLLTISPLVFYILDGKLNVLELAVSCFTSLIATMQEQSAAICIATYMILISVTVFKKLFKIITVLPMLPILICTYHLLSSPGVDERMVMEASENFPRYLDFGFIEKAFCGITVFSANTYFLSNFLVLLFIALLSINIYNLTNRHKKILTAINIFAIFVCVVVNYFIAVFERKLPHMIFRQCIIDNEYTLSFYLLFILSLILTVIIGILIIKLITEDRKIGLIVGLSAAAGICALVVMGFTSSVFNSGQRTAFFTNMLIISACVVLFSNLEKNKLTEKIYKITVGYALITFSIDCFAFKLLELPLMG